ncbi:MAG: formylglycine-generating enzyme family protein, partial [Anaerolineae bacterium]|nr:formylglycine-generating enzyme family protein [Anaerolineae bacterium]
WTISPALPYTDTFYLAPINRNSDSVSVILRGGSFDNSDSIHAKTNYRYPASSKYKDKSLGFRCVYK